MTEQAPDFLKQLIGKDSGKGIDHSPLPPPFKKRLPEDIWGGDLTGGNPWGWQKGDIHTVAELGGYTPRVVPFSHQIAATLRVVDKVAYALLMEMGTGKTKVLIDDFAMRVEANEAADLLIVAPTGVYRGWEKEWRDHAPEWLVERALVARWWSGGGVQHRRALEQFLRAKSRPRVFLVNAEALSSVQEAAEACKIFLTSRTKQSGTIGVDESTLMRDPSSNRTSTIMELRPLATHRRIATGLPTPRSPLDLYGQFAFLDWRILNQRIFHAFKSRYAIMKKISVPRHDRVGPDGEALSRSVNITVGYRNVEELRDLIAPYSFRVTKEQCLDLPPKLYEREDVDFTAEQTRVYTELKRQATSELSSMAHVTATDVMTRRTRLLEICLGFVTDEGGVVHRVASNRMRQLLELLDRSRGKAIIWAPRHFALQDVYDSIGKEFGKGTVVRFWGQVKDQEREEAVSRFQGDQETRWFVGNPSTAGRGRTLTEASLVVYYGCTSDLEHRLQSEDRAHRAGLRHAVTYVDMVAPGTVEEKNLALLRAKIDLASVVLGEQRSRWLE